MVELMYRSEFIGDVDLIDLELRIIEMLGQKCLAFTRRATLLFFLLFLLLFLLFLADLS
jgi:hypothetical protein